MSVSAIVLAGGSSARFGGAKQFASLRGMRLVDHAVAAARAACDAVILVLPADARWDGEAVDSVVGGGDTRLASARRGLAAVDPEASVIVLHDAAHPLASVRLFSAVIEAVEAGADVALPIVPAAETVMRVQDGRAMETVVRDGLVSVQVPQAFRPEALQVLHASGLAASDESVLAQRLGSRIAFVPGDPANLHVTTPAELAVAERLATTRSDRVDGKAHV